MAEARRQKAKLIYLANPDNPMGSWHKGSVIEDLVANLPPHSLLLLDEAYIDLAPADAVPRIDPFHPQVIRLRTFSKGYGMAGARVGYAICAPDMATAFNKVRDHFGMARISQIGALAALRDQAWLNQVKAKVTSARDRISSIAVSNGLVPLPSATNFVTIDCGRDGEFARRILKEMANRCVFIRMPGVAPLDRCIRISVGDASSLDVLEEALPLALAAAKG